MPSPIMATSISMKKDYIISSGNKGVLNPPCIPNIFFDICEALSLRPILIYKVYTFTLLIFLALFLHLD
jgi:hypothetical protein